MVNPNLQTTHAIQDSTLSANTALGTNNSTTSTAAIDLGAIAPFPATTRFTVQISTTGSTNGANSKNVNISLQHSDVNTAANFTNIAELAPLTIAMSTGTLAATTRNVTLPPSAKQFLRIICATENFGGNPNDATATLKLLL
jgi:hypothetical protein